MGYRRRRMPVASLLVALVCIAIAIGVIVFVPSHAVDTSHATHQVTPGAINLPPTAVPPTATPAR